MTPFRLCCGQQHLGPECPDGKVMCCLCFDRVSKEELHKDKDGCLENVCLKCAKREQEQWPLLQCATCGHRQTFASELVSVVMSEGYCDKCNAQRNWIDVNEL